MENVQGTIRKYDANLNAELSRFPFLNQLERQTNLKKTHLALGFVVVYLLLIYLNVGGIGQLFANLASVVLPGYYSLVALESPGKSDDTQFLTYWVVYAAFTVVEFWSSVIIYWIPAYWLFKTLFFLWLGLPSFSGARYVYSSVLRPLSQKFLGIKASPVSSLNESVRQAAH